MSRDKLLILGVVVLGLLGVLVYKQQQKDASLGTPAVAAKDYPSIGVSDDIDKISITNGDKTEIVLEKTADAAGAGADAGSSGTWHLAKPVKAAASQQTAKDVVGNLRDLKIDSAINLKLDEDVRKDKQLDAAHAVHVVAYKGGEKKLDALFGKSGSAGQLLVLADKPDQVWAVKGYSSYLYTKEAKDFRDKEFLKFDDGNAAQVTIANSHGVMSFTKGDKWTSTLDKKPMPRFAEDKLKSFLTAYKSLSADDFGDGKTTAETGLDKPESTVTISLKDGAGTYTVLVGGPATGSNRWAKRADGDTIVQITNYAAEWATSDASKFQNAADAGAPGDAGKK